MRTEAPNKVGCSSQVLPSCANPKKHIWIDFGMDKVSDDDVSLNYWINYGKCQDYADYVTHRLLVEGIHIADGISSFNRALDIVKRKDKDVDVYVVYESLDKKYIRRFLKKSNT